MLETFQSIVIGGAAGIVSAIVTYISTRARLRLDLFAEYDKKLQESRLQAYIALWALLEPLARYSAEPVTGAILLNLSKQTRAWYFRAGGIYLTQSSRKPYFNWKKLLQSLLNEPDIIGNPEASILPARLQLTIEACSTLRTALSDDIGTKRLSRL